MDASTSTSRRADERGFTLLLVLLALVVVTIVGTTTLYVASSDRLAAEARERSALARAAAETGLSHLLVGFQPSLVLDQRAASGGTEFSDPLSGAPFTETPREVPAPPGLRAEYVAWGGAPAAGGAQVIVEGRILSGERIVARSRLSAVVVMTGDTGGYGDIGSTAGNTGVETTGGTSTGYSGI
ncbi:hypothetical protein [Vulgatibacter incomptus]|uniref:Type 4 fimbrial biogenesis protein PilX N-terminal domain-containing protein n=1 Tax=Vulgatibacter incomptus TaxID=1391653 RepID=A0A0K1PF38_9BACT|nr:hypothetical protein [Vulgatibacter incomptus]AKU91709.1 hypothetical protein AKJ08_2096 [Vulgatibacter incomptus]